MNKKERPILTIAIPTFNRPERVKSQVLSILPKLTEEMVLLVIDNHSKEDVRNLFCDIQLPSNVIIERNQFNIGGDANIAKCFELCTTPWLWTLSDDDTLSEDAIDIVLADIKHNSNTAFINYNRDVTSTGKGLNCYLDVAMSRYSYLFWISVCVYNVELLKEYMCDYFSLTSCMQPGVFLVFKALFCNSDYGYLLSKKEIVVSGDKDITWNRERFILSSLFFIDIIEMQLPAYSKKIGNAITKMCYDTVITQYRRNRDFRKAFYLCYKIRHRRGFFPSIYVDSGYFYFTQLRLLKSVFSN